MKKTMTIIVFFAVLLISMSAYSGRVYEAAEGYKAPAFTLAKSDTTVQLADLKGRYVLLSFWASCDAASRVDAARYSDYARSADEERFCLLSVNMDRSERLFREIVRRDNLSAETQFHVTGDVASRIAEDYHLADGFNSYLIDPEGQVIATNPSAEILTQVLRN
ncbi:MAG: TlpA family protein disulfide reductase [Paramuribaculum sp.]|nr:TlpA family protein disulfide reductase [Paramuribaculum sp.]